MKILAFSTVESFLSVSFFDGKNLFQNIINQSGQQAELLIFELEKILNQHQIWYQDLDLIATVNGPGSFTGVRVGLVTARILKLATSKPLITLNSCEVIASKYRYYNGRILVLLDAKMGEFFLGEFIIKNQKVVQLAQPSLIGLEQLSEIPSKEKFLLCGSGKKIVSELLKKPGLSTSNFEVSEEEDMINADLIAILAHQKFCQGEAESNLDPLYLREPKIGKRK